VAKESANDERQDRPDPGADVSLKPRPGGGATIHWRARFDPQVRGTGWLWRLFMTGVLRTVSRQLALAAEQVSDKTPR